MEKRIIIAGSGGQGILFLGKALARASVFSSKKVTWFPSYGAEIRGGTANCTVIVSDDMIGSPVVQNPDILIVMNRESLDKFQSGLKSRGILFFDSSLIDRPVLRKNIRAVPVPATRIASFMGNTKSANMVMLGALIAETGLLNIPSVTAFFKKYSELGRGFGAENNLNLFFEGVKQIENTKS